MTRLLGAVGWAPRYVPVPEGANAAVAEEKGCAGARETAGSLRARRGAKKRQEARGSVRRGGHGGPAPGVGRVSGPASAVQLLGTRTTPSWITVMANCPSAV